MHGFAGCFSDQQAGGSADSSAIFHHWYFLGDRSEQTDAQEGRRFMLQGDCATFSECVPAHHQPPKVLL
jgi:hypothetical protein